MKIAHKFLLVFFLSFVIVIGVNIVSFKYFATQYFQEYLITQKQKLPDINFDIISKLLSVKNLDQKTIDDYLQTLKDLSNFSDSLEQFSQNPQAYTPTLVGSLQKLGVPNTSIEQDISLHAISNFMGAISNFSSLNNSTPEGIFMLKMVKSLALVNAVLLFFIGLFLYIWIRFTFSPIQSMVHNISQLVHNRKYGNIAYKKHDEFL